jgi:cystathionine beta-lyase
VAEICERHNVFVISDEIHADFAFSPHKYTPYLSVSETAAQHSAACLSPAKTFNIAGIMDAIVVIPNGDYRQHFHEFEERYQINHVNVFASVAAEVAYQEGAEWLDAALAYIQGNVDLIRGFLRKNDTGISFIEPEGTFLVWMDFRSLGLNTKELAKFLADAGVALSLGHWFGREGAGFARMTVACPRATVQRALDNLAAAVKTLT